MAEARRAELAAGGIAVFDLRVDLREGDQHPAFGQLDRFSACRLTESPLDDPTDPALGPAPSPQSGVGANS